MQPAESSSSSSTNNSQDPANHGKLLLPIKSALTSADSTFSSYQPSKSQSAQSFLSLSTDISPDTASTSGTSLPVKTSTVDSSNVEAESNTTSLSTNGENTDIQNEATAKRKFENTTQSGSRKKIRFDNWEYKEKTNLLQALLSVLHEKKVFLKDNMRWCDHAIEVIKEKLGDNSRHTPKEIKDYLMHLLRDVKKERGAHDEPIDKWLELLKILTPPGNVLEQQLRSSITVAIEEPIPEFLSSKKKKKSDIKFPTPDFAAVYKYLACAVSDTPLPELSPIDSLLVEDCMQSLMEQIKSLDDGDLRLNLRKIFLHLNNTPGEGPEEDVDEDVVAQLSKGNIYNPLGINQNLIVPVPPD